MSQRIKSSGRVSEHLDVAGQSRDIVSNTDDEDGPLSVLSQTNDVGGLDAQGPTRAREAAASSSGMDALDRQNAAPRRALTANGRHDPLGAGHRTCKGPPNGSLNLAKCAVFAKGCNFRYE